MTQRHHHYPEKYYLTVPFAKFPKRFGTHSRISPRHMTVLPWFRMWENHDIEALTLGIREYCHRQEPFEVTFGDVKGYGDDGNEPGQPVIDGREKVIALHCGLLAVVRNWAEVIDDRWCGARHYDPHSSLVGQEPFGHQPIGVWSVLEIAKHTKEERRVNDPDKEYSAGFRLGSKPDVTTDVVVG